MMGQKTHTESLFYYFRLEDQIPEDHLLRLMDRHIDFSFVRKQLKEFYSPTGQSLSLPIKVTESLQKSLPWSESTNADDL